MKFSRRTRARARRVPKSHQAVRVSGLRILIADSVLLGLREDLP
jgi:hypothetical protein